jgi:hypothetical protein
MREIGGILAIPQLHSHPFAPFPPGDQERYSKSKDSPREGRRCSASTEAIIRCARGSACTRKSPCGFDVIGRTISADPVSLHDHSVHRAPRPRPAARLGSAKDVHFGMAFDQASFRLLGLQACLSVPTNGLHASDPRTCFKHRVVKFTSRMRVIAGMMFCSSRESF